MIHCKEKDGLMIQILAMAAVTKRNMTFNKREETREERVSEPLQAPPLHFTKVEEKPACLQETRAQKKTCEEDEGKERE